MDLKGRIFKIDKTRSQLTNSANQIDKIDQDRQLSGFSTIREKNLIDQNRPKSSKIS